MKTNSKLSTTKPKTKNKLSKQLEEEQNHRNGDHMRIIIGKGRGKVGVKVKGIRSIIGRYKIDRGRLRLVYEMEKSKTLYV